MDIQSMNRMKNYYKTYMPNMSADELQNEIIPKYH